MEVGGMGRGRSMGLAIFLHEHRTLALKAPPARARALAPKARPAPDRTPPLPYVEEAIYDPIDSIPVKQSPPLPYILRNKLVPIVKWSEP